MLSDLANLKKVGLFPAYLGSKGDILTLLKGDITTLLLQSTNLRFIELLNMLYCGLL